MAGLEQFQIPHDPRATHQLHWQPGRWGKGILAQDGTLHHWTTGDRSDGDPNHRRYMMESPGFGYDPYPRGNFRDSDDHLYFWVDPEGNLSALNRSGDTDALNRISQIDPRLRYTPEGDVWRFSDNRSQERALTDSWEERRRQWQEERDREREEWQRDPIGAERRYNWDKYVGDGDTQHHPDVEWVPTHELKRFMEYDRRPGGEHAYGTPERYEALKQHIQTNGFNNPVVLEFNPDTGMAHMGEGNHRTAIALDLGLPAMPVRVNRSRRSSPTQIPVTLSTEMAGRNWLPDSLKPSHISLPTVPPPGSDGNQITAKAHSYPVVEGHRTNEQSVYRHLNWDRYPALLHDGKLFIGQPGTHHADIILEHGLPRDAIQQWLDARHREGYATADKAVPDDALQEFKQWISDRHPEVVWDDEDAPDDANDSSDWTFR